MRDEAPLVLLPEKLWPINFAFMLKQSTFPKAMEGLNAEKVRWVCRLAHEVTGYTPYLEGNYWPLELPAAPFREFRSVMADFAWVVDTLNRRFAEVALVDGMCNRLSEDIATHKVWDQPDRKTILSYLLNDLLAHGHLRDSLFEWSRDVLKWLDRQTEDGEPRRIDEPHPTCRPFFHPPT